jgi:hypothetical protein
MSLLEIENMSMIIPKYEMKLMHLVEIQRKKERHKKERFNPDVSSTMKLHKLKNHSRIVYLPDHIDL